MNVLLDSNLEALAFNYLNFGFFTIFNNLWTSLALLTAALSFWKIRSSNSPPKSLNPLYATPEPDTKPLKPLEHVAEETEKPREKLTAVFEEVDGVKKGKFTVHYENEEIQCGRSKDYCCYGMLPIAKEWKPEDRKVDTLSFDSHSTVEWWKCWDNVLSLRKGENENGWYTCLDLTEFNGNVVKFWDGGCCKRN